MDSNSLTYEEALFRASQFNRIVAFVQSVSPPGDLPWKRIEASTQHRRPQISIVDRKVVCNGVPLDLSVKPLALRLFDGLLKSPGLRLSGEDLVAYLYQIADLEKRTTRYSDALHANATKLISRTRRLAVEHFGEAAGSHVEWFVYDQGCKMWSLLRLILP